MLNCKTGVAVIIASLIALVGAGTTFAASASPQTAAISQQSIKTITLTVKDCNVTVQNTKDGQFRYDYDKSLFQVTPVISGSNLSIKIGKIANRKPELTDIVSIYLPLREYETIIVKSDHAGVGLPALDANLHLTNNNGSMSVKVPGGFDKTIDCISSEGSGNLAIDKSAKDYLLKLSSKDSAVSVPTEFPAFAPNRVWQYQNGNGAAKINLMVQKSSFAIAVSDDSNAPTSRAASLTQNFKQYEPFGVIYNAEQDIVYHNDKRVKLFVDFKKDKEPGMKYAFDLCYRDFEADSNLYLEAVEDSSGKVTGVRLLDNSIAREILGDAALADSGKSSSKTQVWTLDGDTELEAYGISATDRVKKESVPQSVKDWIIKCDSKQGAYISASKTTDSYITYMYYNAGGRYPWNITCDGETVGIDLLFDDTFCGADGYTLLSFTSPKEYKGVVVSLNGTAIK